MPDGRPALSGAERKRRHDRRARDGLIHARADLPPEIGEWLIDHGFKADDCSTDPAEWGVAMVAAVKRELIEMWIAERNTFAETVVKDMGSR